MNRACLSSFVVLLVISLSGISGAQQGPGRGQGVGGVRGPGFGGGRGPGRGLGRGRGLNAGRGVRDHSAPDDQTPKPHPLAFPVIAASGGVVQLPTAAQQPRAGTKLLVDLTSGSDPDQLNSGLQKVAKFVNLNAGGGAEPADAQIAVVFHGDATLTVLSPDAYAAKFQTDGNPNLKLLQQLSDSGVDLYVCGQSLISKGSEPSDVAMFVKTAVSAMTTVVNLQTDGYAYLPLAKVAPNAPTTKLGKIVEKKVDTPSEDDHAHGPGMGRGTGDGNGTGAWCHARDARRHDYLAFNVR